MLTIAFPLMIAFYAFTNFSFFALHPLLMSLAFAFLVPQGLMVFNRSSSLVSAWKVPDKVNAHGWMLFAGLCSALAGFVVIYITKNRGGKQHFTSWHGYLGLIVTLYMCVQVVAGVYLKYAGLKAVNLPPGVSLGQVKNMHSISGTFSSTAALVVLFLGLQSSWFNSVANYYAWGVGAILLVFLGMTIVAQLQQRLARKMQK